MMLRRIFTGCLLAVVAGAGLAHADTITVQDVAGRAVTLKAPARRIVLGEGRYIRALAILEDGNPAQRVVGMTGGHALGDPAFAQKLMKRWPENKNIALFGGRGAESVSVEKIITLKPDVAIFGLADHGPGRRSGELISQLQSAGIKILFIDFRMDPLNNTLPSIGVLGKVLGRQDRADAYAKFYVERRARIEARVAGFKGPRPRVFLQAHLGRMPCCVAMAKGMLGPMIGFVGGRNMSAEISPGPIGRHTSEFLISGGTEVYIATASGHPADFEAGKRMIVLGGNVTGKMAQASLIRATDVTYIKALPAWQTKRVHGIWHDFYNSPHNIVALEYFAKWIHPQLFADVDPEATRRLIEKRFSPFETAGTYAVSLSSN